MKVEIVANGTVSLALIPENDIDRAVLKAVIKQSNEFVEVTKQTQILNKIQFAEGIVIQPKQREEVPVVNSTSSPSTSDVSEIEEEK